MVEPRIAWIPKNGSDEVGKQAVELAYEAGLELDDWQAFALKGSLRGTTEQWDVAHVGLNVARQNGKGAIIEARMLAELFIVKSPLTIYSAHNFDTALVHFRRVASLIEATPKLERQLVGRGKGSRPYGITFGKGNEGVELKDGCMLRFRTRTAGGGRGFSADCLILDEAMFLPEFTVSALLPIISARPNPQVWYVGSSVDQQIHEHGVVFARVRQDAIDQNPDVAYFEWSVEAESPDTVPRSVLNDQAAWAQANPALGIRIKPEYIASELPRLGPRGFAVERLGIGDWPRTDYVATNPLDYDAWAALAEPGGVIATPEFVVFDVSPERKAAVVLSGRRKDGLVQAELLESKGGTAWVAPEVARIVKTHKVKAVCDGRGPSSSLVPELRDLGIDVEQLTATEHAQACGHLMDGVERRSFRHLDDPELNGAVRAAVTRPLGDAWAWSRKDSSTNIAPLVAFTLAISAALTHEKPVRAAFAFG